LDHVLEETLEVIRDADPARRCSITHSGADIRGNPSLQHHSRDVVRASLRAGPRAHAPILVQCRHTVESDTPGRPLRIRPAFQAMGFARRCEIPTKFIPHAYSDASRICAIRALNSAHSLSRAYRRAAGR